MSDLIYTHEQMVVLCDVARDQAAAEIATLHARMLDEAGDPWTPDAYVTALEDRVLALRQKVVTEEFALSGATQALEWIRDTDSPETAPLIARDWLRSVTAREAAAHPIDCSCAECSPPLTEAEHRALEIAQDKRDDQYSTFDRAADESDG